MVADEVFEKRAPGCRTLEPPGIRDLELAKRQLVDVSGVQIRAGERGGQPLLPAPKEALHRAGSEPVADLLQRQGVLAITEAVVQGGVADAEALTLALRPGVPIEPDPHRPRRIG